MRDTYDFLISNLLCWAIIIKQNHDYIKSFASNYKPCHIQSLDDHHMNNFSSSAYAQCGTPFYCHQLAPLQIISHIAVHKACLQQVLTTERIGIFFLHDLTLMAQRTTFQFITDCFQASCDDLPTLWYLTLMIAVSVISCDIYRKWIM